MLIKDEFNFGGKPLGVKHTPPNLCAPFLDPNGLAVSNSSKNSYICNAFSFVDKKEGVSLYITHHLYQNKHHLCEYGLTYTHH